LPPIFKILSPLEREGNFQQNPCIICHQTLSMLPHYFWEFKSSNLAQIWKKMQTKMSHEPVKFPWLSENKAMCKLGIYQLYSFVD